MYYSIATFGEDWLVRFNGQTLARFETHAEAIAFIKGRRSAEGRES